MVEETTSARKTELEVIGDQILVGDIRDAKNIAIGTNIQQTIYEGYTAQEVAHLIAEARKTAAQPAAAIAIPPPPEPTKPPEIIGFVGRDQELTYFVNMLETSHLAVIAGMAGVGKTALAATLVTVLARESSRIFWHSFHEGEGIDAVIWNLAGFLAWHGQDELWKLLQSTRLTGGQPPPAETLFDYLLQLVRDGNYLLCFDDFHHVDDDPVLNQLVVRLRQALTAGHLSIIITSRRVPEFITLAQVAPIQGLSARDTRRLLQAKGLPLTPPQIDQLYILTGGNAEFLILASAALQNARNPQDLLDRLAESDDIERYLLREVDDGLTGQERTVMQALAVLLGYAATRDAIEAVIERGNVLRILRGLSERHLLMVQEMASGRAYRQHDLVRTFYYEQNSRRERKQLHTRAGAYYRDDETDLLLAGIHYERAGDVTEAARLATQDLWGIVNRGQIRPLRGLLEQFGAAGLAAEGWIAVNLAKGQLYTLQAEGGLAEASLTTALNQIATLADGTQQRILAARACRGMGELLEEKSPRDALGWLEQGLDRLQGADQMEEAALYIRSGTLHVYLNDYAKAQAASKRGQALLPPHPTYWHSTVLRDLSGAHFHLGQIEQARVLVTQAIEICKQLNNPFHAIVPMMNLAVYQFTLGENEAGLAQFDAALALAIQTVNQNVQAQIEQNLGTAKFSMGKVEEALHHLQTSLNLARTQGNQRILLYSLRNLIDLYIDQKDWNLATQCLQEAESIAMKIDDQTNLMTIFGFWCEVKLATGEVEAALSFAKQHAALALALGEIISQGISQGYLGKVLTAQGDFEEAFIAFANCLALIGDEEPYQRALTKMDWGKALLAAKVWIAGQSMLTEAKQIFCELENLYWVAQIDELLASYPAVGMLSLNKETKQ